MNDNLQKKKSLRNTGNENLVKKLCSTEITLGNLRQNLNLVRVS